LVAVSCELLVLPICLTLVGLPNMLIMSIQSGVLEHVRVRSASWASEAARGVEKSVVRNGGCVPRFVIARANCLSGRRVGPAFARSIYHKPLACSVYEVHAHGQISPQIAGNWIAQDLKRLPVRFRFDCAISDCGTARNDVQFEFAIARPYNFAANGQT